MQYLVIIPIFLAAVAVLFTAAALASGFEPWRRAVPYLVRGTIGAALGFVACNVLLLLATWIIGFCLHQTQLPDWLQAVVRPGYGLLLVYGPVVLSPLGFALGFWAGASGVARKRAMAAANSSRNNE